jgi:hypothetical protein
MSFVMAVVFKQCSSIECAAQREAASSLGSKAYAMLAPCIVTTAAPKPSSINGDSQCADRPIETRRMSGAAAARNPGRHRSARANSRGRWGRADRNTMREVCRPGSCFTFFFCSGEFVLSLRFWKGRSPEPVEGPSSSSILCHDTKDQDRERRVGGGDGGGGGVGIDVSADEWDGQASETIFGPRKPYLDSTALPPPQQGEIPKACFPHEDSWKVPSSFQRCLNLSSKSSPAVEEEGKVAHQAAATPPPRGGGGWVWRALLLAATASRNGIGRLLPMDA